MEDMAREMRALHETTLDMHRENRRTDQQRSADFDRGLAAIATSLHALELTVATSHSALHERIALHELAPHHAGTLERLTQHEGRLDGHDKELGGIHQRLQTEDGRHAAQTESRGHRYALWGLVVAGTVGLAGVLSAWGTAILNAWVSLTAGGGPHPPVK